MSTLSVALVSDLLEENWPSMDLVSDMLYTRLRSFHDSDCEVSQLRPVMHRRFSNSLLSSRQAFAWNADRLINRFFDYPRWLRQHAEKFDVFHVIDHSYAQLVHQLPRERTVVSCHDLDAFRCLLEPDQERRSPPFRLMTRRILNGFLGAKHILCVSQAVRNSLIGHGLLPPERVSVVPNGVHPSCSSLSDPEADQAVEQLLQMKKDAPYLIHVGSTIPRKRIDTLLRVFASVWKSAAGVKLVRVGGSFTPPQEELANQLGIREFITVLPYLDRRTLAAVYRRATLLLLTSEAEGFGLPVVEAMACGCPVVVSDILVLREIGGSVAAFCPVQDIPAWTETINELLRKRENDPADWEKWRASCVTNAARFSWERSAAECLNIYRRVLGRSV